MRLLPHPNSPVVSEGSDECTRCRACVLGDCRSTIFTTSIDGDACMLDDEFPVVNFDSATECYRKKIDRKMVCPRSVDALFNNRGVCI